MRDHRKIPKPMKLTSVIDALIFMAEYMELTWNLARPHALSILFSLFLFFSLPLLFLFFSFFFPLSNIVRRPLKRTRPATRLDGSIDKALIKLYDELGYARTVSPFALT